MVEMKGSLHSSNRGENELFLCKISAEIFTKKVTVYSFTANPFDGIPSIIVIVDDGSDEAYQSIFEELHENGCVLLRHAAEDVYRLAVEARRHPDALVLGVRNSSEGGIPPKSLLGNRMTSFIFAMLYRRKWRMAAPPRG